MKINNFSIIIPIFNEEFNIKPLVYEIMTYFKKNDYEYEIVLVNDGSNDKTHECIRELKNEFTDKIRIINNKINLGQSYSIIKGIRNSRYENIVTIDGDGQNNPKDIQKLLLKYFSDENLKLVGGIRNKRKDNLIKIYSSKIANSIRSYLLNDNCKDTGCSLKVFEKNIFLQFPEFDGLHRFIPALYSGFGAKTDFLDVDHRSRINGKSNYGTFSRLIIGCIDIIRVLRIINKIKND